MIANIIVIYFMYDVDDDDGHSYLKIHIEVLEIVNFVYDDDC